MIYKMELSDDTDSMVFDLLEVPIIDNDVTGIASNTTIDGNVFNDYLWLKKQYVQKWSIMCKDEYEQLRGFWLRQFGNAKVPFYRLFYGNNDFDDLSVTTSNGHTQVTNPTERTAPASVNQLLGNATQQTYSGKNLLVYPGLSGNTTINGVTFTQASDGKVVGSGTTTAGMNWYYVGSPNYWTPTVSGTYTLSFDGTIDNNGTVLYCYDRTDSTTAMRCTATQKSNTGTLTAGHLYQIYFNNGSAGKAVNVSGYAQLESGSTATAYEPYVGGTASPNPDYPQDINVVTGEQTVKICGKNLLGGYSYDYNAGGAMATYHEDGTLSVAGTCTATAWSSGTSFVYTRGFTVRLPAGTYTFTASGGKETQLVSVLPDGTGETANATIPTGEGSRTFTTTTERVFYARIRVVAGATDYSVKFMLEKSASATDYEPYQGQSYEVNLGKNLFDKDNLPQLVGYYIDGSGAVVSGAGNYITWIQLQPNKTYTLSQSVRTSNTIRVALFSSAVTSSSTGTLVGTFLSGTTIKQTFTTTSTNYWLGWVFWDGSVSDSSTYPKQDCIDSIQVEAGSQATSYADYFEPIELAKIGNYQDYIWNDDGTWKIHKEIGKVVFDGSETWYLFGNNSGFFLQVADALAPTSSISTDAKLVLSNNYTACLFNEIYGSTIDYGVSLYAATNPINRICFRNKDITTVADFKTWLTTHNTTVYYALAEPVDEEITNGTLLGELNAIGELYSGQNNIWLTPSAGAQGELALDYRLIYDEEVDIIPQTPVVLTLTDGGVINPCECRQNIQLTMRETKESSES